MNETKTSNPPLFDIMEMQETVYQTNVTLRDLFAAFALAGLKAGEGAAIQTRSYMVEESFRLADAMLAERERK